jgi:hypothetical protein
MDDLLALKPKTDELSEEFLRRCAAVYCEIPLKARYDYGAQKFVMKYVREAIPHVWGAVRATLKHDPECKVDSVLDLIDAITEEIEDDEWSGCEFGAARQADTDWRNVTAVHPPARTPNLPKPQPVSRTPMVTPGPVSNQDREILGEVVKELRELKLSFVKRPEERPWRRNDQTCFTCKQKGHMSPDCPTKLDNSKGRVSFCMIDHDKPDENECPGAAEVLAVKRSRIDVEDLLDGPAENRSVLQPRTGVLPPPGPSKKNATEVDTGVTARRKTPVKKASTGRLLTTSRVEMSLDNYLRLNPREIDPFVNEIRSLRPPKRKPVIVGFAEGTLGTDTPTASPEPLVYVAAKIADQPVPVLVDTGADCSMIRRSLAEKLNLPLEKMSKAIRLKGAFQGNAASITATTLFNLEFMEGFSVPLRIYVVDDGPVYLLLGRSDLQSLGAVVDFPNELLCLTYGDLDAELQLCSKEQLQASVDAIFGAEDDSDQESGDVVPQILRVQIDDLKERQSLVASLSEDIPVEVKPLIEEYGDIFPKSSTDITGVNDFQYSIEVMPDHRDKPLTARLRRYSPVEKKIIKEELDKMIEADVIQPSKSSWISPVVLVPKPDGSTRFCVDYRKLNGITERDRFPLPRIEDCVDSLEGKKYYSTLDCMSGYWQIPLELASRKYTAFITPFGVFEFKVMPFGLSNAPAAFSRYISRLLGPFHFDFVVIYIDDIAIYSKTLEEHLKHLEIVFQTLRSANLKLKLTKCAFLQTEFRFLGLLVTEQGLKPDPRKVEVLLRWEAPRTVHEIRQFMGLASYFRRFVPQFSAVARPIQALLGKGKRFIWDEACQQAFEQLRKAIVSAPTLKIADFDNQFILSTDASDSTIGGCLEQYDSAGVLRPVAFFSRRLLPAEENYTVHDREALAVVTAIKLYRCYLLHKPFVVYTDNSAIVSLLRTAAPTGRLARWIQTLSEFDFEIKHRSGRKNVVADALSRAVLVAAVSAEPNTLKIFNDYLVDGLDPPGGTTSSFLRAAKRYIVIDGELYRRAHPYPLKVMLGYKELEKLLHLLHDQTGHMALGTVWPWIRQHYWRPQIFAEVRHYIRSCSSCQHWTLRRPSYQFDGQSEISGIGHWCFDVLGPFPTDYKGNKYLLTGVEKLSSFPLAIPMAFETAQCVVSGLEQQLSIFGWAKSIVSDNGACFTSALFKRFCDRWSIEHRLIPAYQPEWNGHAERLNSTIRFALARSVDGDYSTWSDFVPGILTALRFRAHSRTGLSPHFVMFGISPNVVPQVNSLPASVNARCHELDALPGIRQSLLRDSAHSNPVRQFPVGGNFVLALAPALRKRGSASKLAKRYHGPFKVLEQLPHHLYRVVDELGMSTVFHASRLVSFFSRGSSGFEGGSVEGPSGEGG